MAQSLLRIPSLMAIQQCFMITFKKILFILIFSCTLLPTMFSQENTGVPQRSAEQEAIKQTDKLKQELQLTAEQAKRIYEINLRYERKRQVSNTRSEAIQRIKNKNTEIEYVLNEEQKLALQTKRYERSALETSGRNRSQALMSTGLRNSAQYSPHSTVRVVTSDMSNHNNSRNNGQSYRTGTPPSVVVRSTTGTGNGSETPASTTTRSTAPASGRTNSSTTGQSSGSRSEGSSSSTTNRQTQQTGTTNRR